jgi:hypothetical protein
MFKERWQKVWWGVDPTHLPSVPEQQLFEYVKQRVKYRRDTGDHWQTPDETLARGAGDCEDFAILWLALGLQHFRPERMRMVIGSAPGEGHHALAVMGDYIYDVRLRMFPHPASDLHSLITPLWSLHMTGQQVAHLPMKKRS